MDMLSGSVKKIDGLGSVDNNASTKIALKLAEKSYIWDDTWQVGSGEPSLEMSAP